MTEYVETIVESGFTKAPMTITLKDKEDIIKALCLHHIILKCKAELDQLKEGLRVLGVATAIEVIPETFQSLFTASEEILTPGSYIFVGTGELCQHNFERNRYLKASHFQCTENPYPLNCMSDKHRYTLIEQSIL